MEYRNPHYNRHGSIDCEVNHPIFGWIPFTASDDDPSGNAIYKAIIGDGGKITPYIPEPEVVVPPDRVSARQFKMQLHLDGLKDRVDGWISSQGKLVQIAYDNSGTFVRGEPMMRAGFAALGFSEDRIDNFFKSAAEL